MKALNYMVKAVVDGEVYIFQYETSAAVDALEQFWHDDYPDVLDGKDGPFHVDVIAIDNGKVIRKYTYIFNAAVFHAFFDHGHTVDGPYTLDQFVEDIKRDDEAAAPDAGLLTRMMDHWAGFCYNHPRFEEVICWMVGSAEHYLYHHFCAKWLHICNDECHNDTMAVWIRFYRELDTQWATRLMQYVYCEWRAFGTIK